MMRKLLVSVLVSVGAISVVWAGSFKPAVIYGTGSKNDKSFNQSAWTGAKRFTKDTGIKFKDFEPSKEIQIPQMMEKFAKRKYNPIIGIGFTQAFYR